MVPAATTIGRDPSHTRIFPFAAMPIRVPDTLFDMAGEPEVRFIRDRNDLNPKFPFGPPPHDGLIDVDHPLPVRQPQPNRNEARVGRVRVPLESHSVQGYIPHRCLLNGMHRRVTCCVLGLHSSIHALRH
jgi:hypothetical protein